MYFLISYSIKRAKYIKVKPTPAIWKHENDQLLQDKPTGCPTVLVMTYDIRIEMLVSYAMYSAAYKNMFSLCCA